MHPCVYTERTGAPTIVGLDLSPRGTGVVLLDSLGRPVKRAFFTQKKKLVERFRGAPDDRAFYSWDAAGHDMAAQFARAIYTIETVLDLIESWKPEYVAIEQIPFHAEGKNRDQLHWLHALGMYGLTSNGLKFTVRPRPIRYYRATDTKIIATGKGNAQKPDMMAAADGAGFSVEKYDDAGEDLADAFWVAQTLRLELLLRSMTVRREELHGDALRVFFPAPPKKPKKNPAPGYLDQPFMKIDAYAD